MEGLLKADLTGHGHFSQIERKGLNVCALLLRSALKSRCSSIISTIRHSISENKFLIGVHYTVIKPIRYLQYQ